MRFMYNLFRRIYLVAAHIAAWMQPKARLWVQGQKGWLQHLPQGWNPRPGAPVLWMHCASLGEFEQGRPVLEALQQQYPRLVVVLTFFSPSGYEVRKNYAGADRVLYLPFDGPRNAKLFLDAVQPTVAIFVKYEFWHYYLHALKARNIPALLIAGIFRPKQPFFQKWGSFHRQMLHCFTCLFVQNEASVALLQSIGLHDKTVLAGDPRFDRVLATAHHWQPDAVAAKFVNERPLLVAGSTWPQDEQLLAGWLAQQPEWKLILAPHEVNKTHLRHIEKLYPGALRYSDAEAAGCPLDAHNVLLIDRIGLLARLYKYGTACYVGGGFNKSGHHNILEAAVYGKAVITGPIHEKFAESVALKAAGGSFTVRDSAEMNKVMRQISFAEAGAIAARYVTKQAGATNRILQWIQENRLLTSE